MGKYIIPFITCVFFSTAFSQVLKPFPHGIGFEIGLGYNQLRHHVRPYPTFHDAFTHYRDAFYLTPTLRISYELYPQEWLPTKTFIGYDIAGGKSEKRSNGYEDKYTIRQIELGITVSYKYKRFELGGGIKYNVHMKVIGEYYGVLLQPSGEKRTWSESDMTDFFSDNSTDLGIRISYRIFKFLVSSEAWFGISNIENPDLDEYIDVTKNRFIIIVGYQL